MARLQREADHALLPSRTRKRVLITFSAGGVAQVAPQETTVEAIRRADQGDLPRQALGQEPCHGGLTRPGTPRTAARCCGSPPRWRCPAPLPRWAWSSPGWGSDPFALGVAGGGQHPTASLLWTRLIPRSPAARPARRLRCAGEPARRPVRPHRAPGHDHGPAGLAHSVHVELRGLEPGALVFLPFPAWRRRGPHRPHAHRAIPRRDPRPHLRLGFASCQR